MTQWLRLLSFHCRGCKLGSRSWNLKHHMPLSTAKTKTTTTAPPAKYLILELLGGWDKFIYSKHTELIPVT